MKIALSTDHTGLDKLQNLQKFLEGKGHTCRNFGPTEFDADDDYPDYINPVAEVVASGEYEYGIVFGGSGQGEAIAANRHAGVRCGVYYGPAMAQGVLDTVGLMPIDEYEILRLNRRHNNANMLSLAGRFLSDEQVRTAVSIWLETKFLDEERHVRRIKKIDA